MLLPQLLSLSWQGLAVRPPSRTALRMAAASREDAESNARLLKALMEDGEDGSLVDKVWSSINEEENSMVKDPTVASHLQLDLDDDGVVRERDHELRPDEDRATRQVAGPILDPRQGRAVVQASKLCKGAKGVAGGEHRVGSLGFYPVCQLGCRGRFACPIYADQ